MKQTYRITAQVLLTGQSLEKELVSQLTCLSVVRRYHARRTLNQLLVNRPVMTEQPSTLYAKLLGETAPITWQELQPFFARGALLWVDGALDLIEVALAVAEDDQVKVAGWLQAGQVAKVEEARAEDLLTRDPALWAVVVAPWVLIQERAEAPTVH